MFLLYYTWGFFTCFFIFFKNLVDFFYLKFNKNFLSLKRDFNDLNFFEKLFLVFFSKNDDFKNSVGNIYSNNNLFNYRKKKYPLIFFYHLYSEKTTYVLSNLNKLKLSYSIFNSSVLQKLTFKKVNFFFFKKRGNNEINRFVLFTILQKIFFKKYYNLCSSVFFKKQNNFNLVKLNWLFYIFLINSSSLKIVYDLSKYTDWYDFNFKKKQIFKNNVKYNKNKNYTLLRYKKNNFYYLKTVYKKYNLFYKKLTYNLSVRYKNIITLDLRNLFIKNNKIIFNIKWVTSLIKFYPIRFSESSLNKHIELDNTNSYLFFYIRKNRIFNKGRYSRNRQLYRTGVYWCLWLNIILVYGLYFLFYRFTFNFGYFWWGLLILFYSSIFSRAIKYNYHNIYNLFLELNSFVKWLYLIFYSAKKALIEQLFFYRNFFYRNFFYFNFIKFVDIFYKTITKNTFIYLWENMNYKDESLFRYKTIIHWLNQFYKSLKA